MENYVVRIYRRSSENPENIAGVVEKPDKGENKSFNSKEEFYNIFWPAMLENNTKKLKKTLEFRKYRRFLIKGGTILFDATTDVGKIIDICMGGLSFVSPNVSLDSKEPFNIGIIFDRKQYSTEKIKCSLVKRLGSSENTDIKSENLMNRYSVKFENLTPCQTSQLRHIIQNYTLGDA